ncbi:MAG TPA: two-component regulator propeller domain-containing protein, partial [Bacteroidota bacterium]|nr:two-component regulator propeller domain-containing protein [Bacteroidota bacterium]
PDSTITAVASEGLVSKDFWVGSFNGLARFIPSGDSLNPNSGTWVKYNTDNSPLLSNSVYAITISPLGDAIWMAAGSGSIVYYDLTNDRFGLSFSLPDDINGTVTSIAIDQNDRVWVGSWRGVGVFDAKTHGWIAEYPIATSNGNLPSRVLSVTTNYQSIRWFGTDFGLAELNDTTWTLFTTVNSPLPSNEIRALNYDSKGNLWIGTFSGVAIYNPEGTLLEGLAE